jgi:hypothetical protein
MFREISRLGVVRSALNIGYRRKHTHRQKQKPNPEPVVVGPPVYLPPPGYIREPALPEEPSTLEPGIEEMANALEAHFHPEEPETVESDPEEDFEESLVVAWSPESGFEIRDGQDVLYLHNRAPFMRT